MSGTTYWTKRIRQVESQSPKRAAELRLDRLRGVLRGLDPAVANRAWREVGDALQNITNRYSR